MTALLEQDIWDFPYGYFILTEARKISDTPFSSIPKGTILIYYLCEVTSRASSEMERCPTKVNCVLNVDDNWKMVGNWQALKYHIELAKYPLPKYES